MNSFRYACRRVILRPGFSITVVLMLAVGIGTTTAIFSVFHSVLLQPLPVYEPEKLVNLTSPGPRLFFGYSTGIAGGADTVFSYPMFRDLEQAQDVLAGIAAHRTFDANISTATQTEVTQGLLVSAGYFRILGLSPEVGRLIDGRDEPSAGAATVAVLGHSFWMSRFGGNRDIVGSSVTVNGTSLTVIGVAPEGFSGTTIGVDPAIYVPLTLAWVVQPGLANDENFRGYHWLHLFGRLRDDVSISQAQASLSALHIGILNDVEASLWTGASADVLEQFRNRPISLEPGARGQSARRAGMREPLTLLFSLTVMVLLIVCTNVAGLLLARGATREGEMAVRISIGATRWQLGHELLTEISVLAVLGGLASVPLAASTLRGIALLLPANRSGFVMSGIDASAVVFAAVATFMTMLAFGVTPILRRSRSNSDLALRGATSRLSSSKDQLGFWKSLATMQVAVSVVLLMISGLFVQSIFNISRVDLGMDIDSVVTFSVSPGLNGYDPAQVAGFYRRLDEELSAEPGIVSVSSALVPLLSSSNFRLKISVDGTEADTVDDPNTRYNMVGPDFFRTFSLPMIAGRGFSDGDGSDSARVVIINESFATKFGLDDPIGKRFGIDRGLGTPESNLRIIGVVPDASYSEVKDDAPAQFYFPIGDGFSPGSLNFYVRSGIDTESVMRSIPAIVARVDRQVPVEDLQTLTETFNRNIFVDRTVTIVATIFALVAAILAAFGLYGIVAYSMSRRTRELGLRIALGSTPAGLRVLVLGHVGRIALIGGLIGFGASIAFGRVAESMLFGLSGFNLLAGAGATIGLCIVIVGAGYLPAYRVMRIDPMDALREN